MAKAAPPAAEVGAPDSSDKASDRHLRELQYLYDSISDPTWRRQALDVMRSLAPPGRVADSAAPPVLPKSRAPTSSKRVLLVDDDTDVLVSIGGFLEADHIDVIRVSSGAEALSVLASGEMVDALVTDVVMPTMSGIELIVEARRRQPFLPALIITGYADFAGSSDPPADVAVLRKPFRRHEFVTRVRSLLNVGASHAIRR